MCHAGYGIGSDGHGVRPNLQKETVCGGGATMKIVSPRCIVIAGPNGAGKTTFAREFLLREVGVVHFVNADLIAGGLSPLRPELAARRAARFVLTELTRLVKGREDFAFESTLSGRTYLRLLNRWKADGYRIDIVFLSLPSVQLALQRNAARVRQGGHDVPRADVLRRFGRSWKNFAGSIVPWPVPGPCMTILRLYHDSWRKVHESERPDGDKTVYTKRRSRTAARGEGSSENGTSVSYAYLCLAQWQSRC